MSSTNNRLQRLASDQKLIDGVTKYLSKFAILPVGSQDLAPADIVKILQSRIDSCQAVVAAEAARNTAVKADRDERAKTAILVSSLRRMVVGMFSQSPDTLATFGLKAPRLSKKKVATKAAAVAKGVATRKARHTLGRKQKATIKGQPPATPPPANP